MSTLARLLSELHDVSIQEIPGGFHVKTVGDREIHVLRQIYNWRVVRTDGTDHGYDRGWCFYGNDFVTLLRATAAAAEWDGADDTSPEGWDKNVRTGEYAAMVVEYH
jgi:hypothetical protein